MFIAKMCALVAICGMLCSACVVKNVASKAISPFKKTRVELHCSPKIAIGTGFGPVTFTAFLRVKDPGEKFWCPGVDWYVDQTIVSGHESDCDPYETVTSKEGEPEVWSEPAKSFQLFEGDHIITAKLTRAGRVIASKQCAVTAH